MSVSWVRKMLGRKTSEKIARLEFSSDEAEIRALRIMTEANDTMLTLEQITPQEHQDILRHIVERLEVLEKKYEGMDNIS